MDPGSAGASPARTPTASEAGNAPAWFDQGTWHSRGYLPHFDRPGAVQMITFRFADALPTAALVRINDELRGQPDARRRQRLEEYLDAGHGACHLRDARVAGLFEATLIHDSAKLYHLLAWVVMPNHVHVLIETVPGHTVANIVQAWKSVSAKAANQLLGQTGRFWQPEYYDRAIRDERHFATAVRYIHENPVKAGLVTRAEDWAFSSVSKRRAGARAGEAPALPGKRPAVLESQVVSLLAKEENDGRLKAESRRLPNKEVNDGRRDARLRRQDLAGGPHR